jgi:hypothetical protein
VWARTALQLAAEEERRRITAERQNKGFLETLRDNTDNADDTGDGSEKP